MNLAKILCTFTTALICSGCTQTPNIPPSSLTFSGFMRYDNNVQLYVTLESNQNLTSIFNIYEKQNQNPPMFICSLNKDHNFDVNHTIKSQGLGLLEPDTAAHNAGRYAFKSTLAFNTTEEKSISIPKSITSGNELEALLAGQESISCLVFITAYGFKAYYTDTVEIPTEGLIQDLKERNRAAARN